MNRSVNVYVCHHIEVSEFPREIVMEKGKSVNTYPVAISVNSYVNGNIESLEAVTTKRDSTKKVSKMYAKIMKKISQDHKNDNIVFNLPDSISGYGGGVFKKSLKDNPSVKLIYHNDKNFNTYQKYLEQRSKIKAVNNLYATKSLADKVFDSDDNTMYSMMKNMKNSLHVATDGSVHCGKNPDGYAVCVSENATMFGKQTRGIADINSIEAKAIELAVNKFAQPNRHLVISTDSAGFLSYIATFDMNSKDNSLMSNAARAVYRAVEEGCYITLRKVKAHSNDPLNTAADIIARNSMRNLMKNNKNKKKNISKKDNYINTALMLVLHEMYGKRVARKKKVIIGMNHAFVIDKKRNNNQNNNLLAA